MTGRPPKAPAAGTAERRALLRELTEPGCLVCRSANLAGRQWVTTFVSESHTQPETMQRVVAGIGFCAAHHRVLAAEPTASWLLPGVYGPVLAHAARLVGQPAGPALRCPICLDVGAATGRSLSRIARWAGNTEVRTALHDAGTPCLPHLRELMDRVDPPAARVLAQTLRARIAAERGTGLALLVGADPDAAARDRLRRAHARQVLAAQESAARHGVQRLVHTDLAAGACPVCGHVARSIWRLIDWLAGAAEARDAIDDLTLCPRHLHDLAGTEAGNVAAILADHRDRTKARAQVLLADTGPVPGRLWRRPADRRRLARQLARFDAVPRCRVCEVAAVQQRRYRELLLALDPDPGLRRAWWRAHGLCARHAFGWPAESTPARVAITRLAATGWELAEAVRRRQWDCRYEPVGCERDAWRRAAGLLDGEVYLGQPAAPGEPAPIGHRASNKVPR